MSWRPTRALSWVSHAEAHTAGGGPHWWRWNTNPIHKLNNFFRQFGSQQGHYCGRAALSVCAWPSFEALQSLHR